MSFWGTGAPLLRCAHHAHRACRTTPYTVRLATPADHPAIHDHLRAHFGDPPRTAPYSPAPLPTALFLIALDRGALVGCIRYRYVDHAEERPIHLVDCFCVHPVARGKGCATALLLALRDYATPRGMPCAVFLKEGAPLATAPLASGHYRYRRCGGPKAFRPSPLLSRCPTGLAHRIVAAHRTRSLILLDRTAPQEWWLYRSPTLSVLACVQDTEQRLLCGGKMGWITAWIRYRRAEGDASEEDDARNAMADALTYAAVWAPSMGEWTDEGWKRDGAFHWYTYQWDPAVRIDPHAYVMVM